MVVIGYGRQVLGIVLNTFNYPNVARLLEQGLTFMYPALDAALSAILKSKAS